MTSKMTARFKTIVLTAEDENGQPVELFKAKAHLVTVAERMKIAELIESQVAETKSLQTAIEGGEVGRAEMLRAGLAPIMGMIQVMTDATSEQLGSLIQEDLIEVFQQAQAFSLGTSKQETVEGQEIPKAQEAQA